MKQLPINRLLYLVSLACAGGIVLNIMGTVRPGLSWDPREVQVRSAVKALLERGRNIVPSITQWRYEGTNPFWKQFRLANFTGKRLTARVVDPPENGDDTPVAESDIDLRQKIDVICICYAGDYTQAVVRYRDPLEVQKERKERPVPTPVVSQNTSAMFLHHVGLGDHLRKPFHNFYLVEVSDDAQSVFFEDRAKEKIDNEYPRQEVIKTELELPHNVADTLGEPLPPLPPSPADPNKTTPGSKAPPSRWRDLPETTLTGDGEYNVSRKDLDYIKRNGDKIIHKGVNLGDYSGGTSKSRVQGVSVRKLGKRFQGLGINPGDILISIGGTKVRNRVHAMGVAKRKWRKGDRRFEMVFLRRGQETTITYQFPD